MTLNRRWIIALGFTALLGATAVQAQEIETAKVPFAFSVNGKPQQAGSISATRSGNLVVIRNNDSHESMMLLPVLASVRESAQPSLTFERYGTHYFLRKVHFDNGYVYEVQRTKHEKELAKSEHSELIMVAMR
ncbi:MAG: hypothetical protein JO022_17075 [Acidobacteriaceae bacterium]|nr:hypothetical protein [Acidobacteriaceae bacterium]